MVKNSYFKEGRYLIINADDFGMSHSTNQAIMNLLKNHYISSATLMTTCPWAKEAGEFCKQNPDMNVGVHLTFTSEWDNYKWGPVTQAEKVTSLVDEEGYFYQNESKVEKFAQGEQVRLEISNQIKRAIAMGVDPTHLDNHMGSLYGFITGRDFIEIVFEFCEYYQLPFRLPRNIDPIFLKRGAPDIKEILKKRVAVADEKGIMIIDWLKWFSIDDKQDYNKGKKHVIDILRSLDYGITELYLHPALACDELKAITDKWSIRQFE